MTEDFFKELCFYWFGGTYEEVAKKIVKAYRNGELDSIANENNKEN